MSTVFDTKEIGKLWFGKVWNERDQALARELMAPDAIGHLEGGQEIVGPDAFLAFQSSFLEAIPDLHIEIVSILSDEDDVCIHWTAEGTHTGPGLGFLPSGEKVFFRGVTWFQIGKGRIISGRDFWNLEGLMQTLAAASAVAAARV